MRSLLVFLTIWLCLVARDAGLGCQPRDRWRDRTLQPPTSRLAGAAAGQADTRRPHTSRTAGQGAPAPSPKQGRPPRTPCPALSLDRGPSRRAQAQREQASACAAPGARRWAYQGGLKVGPTPKCGPPSRRPPWIGTPMCPCSLRTSQARTPGVSMPRRGLPPRAAIN